jgi:hypothetical protein
MLRVEEGEDDERTRRGKGDGSDRAEESNVDLPGDILQDGPILLLIVVVRSLAYHTPSHQMRYGSTKKRYVSDLGLPIAIPLQLQK